MADGGLVGEESGNIRIMSGFATASIANEVAVKTAIPASTAKMLRIIVPVYSKCRLGA